MVILLSSQNTPVEPLPFSHMTTYLRAYVVDAYTQTASINNDSKLSF